MYTTDERRFSEERAREQGREGGICLISKARFVILGYIVFIVSVLVILAILFQKAPKTSIVLGILFLAVPLFVYLCVHFNRKYVKEEYGKRLRAQLKEWRPSEDSERESKEITYKYVGKRLEETLPLCYVRVCSFENLDALMILFSSRHRLIELYAQQAAAERENLILKEDFLLDFLKDEIPTGKLVPVVLERIESDMGIRTSEDSQKRKKITNMLLEMVQWYPSMGETVTHIDVLHRSYYPYSCLTMSQKMVRNMEFSGFLLYRLVPFFFSVPYDSEMFTDVLCLLSAHDDIFEAIVDAGNESGGWFAPNDSQESSNDDYNEFLVICRERCEETILLMSSLFEIIDSQINKKISGISSGRCSSGDVDHRIKEFMGAYALRLSCEKEKFKRCIEDLRKEILEEGMVVRKGERDECPASEFEMEGQYIDLIILSFFLVIVVERISAGKEVSSEWRDTLGFGISSFDMNLGAGFKEVFS